MPVRVSRTAHRPSVRPIDLAVSLTHSMLDANGSAIVLERSNKTADACRAGSLREGPFYCPVYIVSR